MRIAWVADSRRSIQAPARCGHYMRWLHGITRAAEASRRRAVSLWREAPASLRFAFGRALALVSGLALVFASGLRSRWSYLAGQLRANTAATFGCVSTLVSAAWNGGRCWARCAREPDHLVTTAA